MTAIVAMLLVSAVAAANIMRPQTAQPPAGSPTQKTLQVIGEGSATGTPDITLLSLAVQTQAPTADQAVSENAAAMTNVLNALNAIGVEKGAISTTYYSLTPIYSQPANQSQPEVISGYTATNSFQINMTDITQAGKALDTAVSAGANEVQGIAFTFSNAKQRSLEQQAAQTAIADAQSKAAAIASAIGVTLTGPIAINPTYTSPVGPIMYTLMAGASYRSSTPIQAGTQTVTATIQVTYAFA